MIKDLFPTKVIIESLSDDIIFKLTTKFSENNTKNWEDIVENQDIITDIVSKHFGGEFKIVDGWIRSGYTSFDLHCDSHYGNQYVCVVQLYGQQEAGGDLVLYDPSWRNPQWMSDSINTDVNTEVIKFKVGQVVIFPSDVWHRVTEYRGSISRII